jgi:hypothetical protein
VLGSAFQDSVTVLRVFALWIPLTALSPSSPSIYFCPDNQINIVNLTSAMVGIAAAVRSAPRFSAAGTAGYGFPSRAASHAHTNVISRSPEGVKLHAKRGAVGHFVVQQVPGFRGPEEEN